MNFGSSFTLRVGALMIGAAAVVMPPAAADVTLAPSVRSAVAGVSPPPACFRATADIVGTEGNDILRGTPKSDVIAGGGGKDFVYGLGGNDRICGGDRVDVLFGGSGDDRLLGGGDLGAVVFIRLRTDHLWGGRGDDHLQGSRRRDDATFGEAMYSELDRLVDV